MRDTVRRLAAVGTVAACAEQRGLFTIISPAIVTSGRYLNPDRAARVALSACALLASREARRARARLGRSPECAGCTEPGLERYSLPYEGFSYLRTLFRLGPRSFLELHRHLGLDKYA